MEGKRQGGLIDGDISASAGRAGDGVADDWITRDFADYEQAARGLGVGEENQVLLGKGGIGDVKVFAHPVKVAAGAAEIGRASCRERV